MKQAFNLLATLLLLYTAKGSSLRDKIVFPQSNDTIIKVDVTTPKSMMKACDAPGEVCLIHNHTACLPLVQSYKDGRTTVLELGRKVCGRNPSHLCCNNPTVTVKQESSPACSERSTCIRFRECSSLIAQFQAGEIDQEYLAKLKCGDKSVCCPVLDPTPQERTNTRNSDSPNYLPRADKDECGLANDLSNIIGGETAKLGRYTFAVLLGSFERGILRYLCGGSLINKWFILSAAHCFVSTPLAMGGKANIGDWKVSTKMDCWERTCIQSQIIDIERVITHENYMRTSKEVTNDIALVRLREAAVYTDFVLPVCLPLGTWDQNFLKVADFNDGILGIRAHAIGWGVSGKDDSEVIYETGSKAQTDYLQVVDLPVISEDQCKQKFPTIRYPLQVCAGGEVGKDSCKGDSGGALLINKFDRDNMNLQPDFDGKWYQIGIVSYGSKDCGMGKPGVYTRVTAYSDWILAKINEG